MAKCERSPEGSCNRLSTYWFDRLKYGYDKEGRVDRRHDEQFAVWPTIKSYQYHSGEAVDLPEMTSPSVKNHDRGFGGDTVCTSRIPHPPPSPLAGSARR